MEEIRFSPPSRQNVDNNQEGIVKEIKPKRDILGIMKFLSKGLFVLILLGAVVWGVRYINPFKKKMVNENAYSAVFLSNGQVYFGKMIENNDDEIVLNSVYYLQANNSGQLAGGSGQNSFNLVKMGNELHGPTNELFINKTQVVFWEYLREDSKVVESIKNYK